ncbi:MAG TPA: hypothetical protein VHQ97_08315 [Solirubrobacterales bacterium]|jgi:hypothetical protein|nr:hypothetical protein [Solirubrobacterales bacterium]
MPLRRASFASVVFALLVLATLAAFAWSQRLKRDPLVLDRVSFVAVPRVHPNAPPVHSFTPNDDCRYDRIRIRFRITQSDRADVQIVKPGGKLILTLARDEFLKRYTYSTFYWDGRMRSDGIAPPGRYKLRVKMLGQGRTLVPGAVMKLHRSAQRPVGPCLSVSGGKS